MIRTSLFSVLLVSFAFAALSGQFAQGFSGKSDLINRPNSTQLAQLTKPRLKLEKCAVEDCSDTPQSN